MKNLFYPALMALGMLVSSGCEKDEKNLDQVEGSTSGEVKQPSVLSTINELIAATDLKYGTNYTERKRIHSGNETFAPGDDVEILNKGIWVFGKNPETGWCDPTLCANVKNPEWCLCGIVISSGGARGSKPLRDVILNTADSPYLIKNVKDILNQEVKDENGNIIRINYEFIK